MSKIRSFMIDIAGRILELNDPAELKKPYKLKVYTTGCTIGSIQFECPNMNCISSPSYITVFRVYE